MHRSTCGSLLHPEDRKSRFLLSERRRAALMESRSAKVVLRLRHGRQEHSRLFAGPARKSAPPDHPVFLPADRGDRAPRPLVPPFLEQSRSDLSGLHEPKLHRHKGGPGSYLVSVVGVLATVYRPRLFVIFQLPNGRRIHACNYPAKFKSVYLSTGDIRRDRSARLTSYTLRERAIYCPLGQYSLLFH